MEQLRLLENIHIEYKRDRKVAVLLSSPPPLSLSLVFFVCLLLFVSNARFIHHINYLIHAPLLRYENCFIFSSIVYIAACNRFVSAVYCGFFPFALCVLFSLVLLLRFSFAMACLLFIKESFFKLDRMAVRIK